MRKLLLIVLGGLAISPATAQAAAQRHGLTEGVNLVYTGGGAAALAVTLGAGYVDDTLFNQTAVHAAVVPNIVTAAGPGALAASTAYYCYVVNTLGVVAGTTFLPNSFTVVCSTTGPTADGHPSVAFAGVGFGPTTHALFIGSVITRAVLGGDKSMDIVPFYRNGQQVLLNLPSNTAVIPQDVAFANPDPYDPGIEYPGAALAFTSLLAYPNVQSYTVAPLPLLSMSAILFDFQITNEDAASHNICLLDPNNHAIACPRGRCTKACEGEPTIDGSVQTGKVAVATYRSSVNFDTTGKIWVGMDKAPAANTRVAVLPALRGYLEPIKHLFSR